MTPIEILVWISKASTEVIGRIDMRYVYAATSCLLMFASIFEACRANAWSSIVFMVAAMFANVHYRLSRLEKRLDEKSRD